MSSKSKHNSSGKWIYAALLGSTMLLSGCQSTSSDAPSIASNRTNNLTAHELKSLFHQQLVAIDNGGSLITLQQAIDTGEQLIQLQPHQDEEIAKVYRVKMLAYFTQPTKSALVQLAQFYQQHPSLRYFDLASPKYLEVITSIEGMASPMSPMMLKSTLQQAIAENPGFVRSKEILGNIYLSEQNPVYSELGNFLFAQMVKAYPENQQYASNYADSQFNLSYEKMCSAADQRSANAAIKAYQHLIKLSADNTAAQSDLASLYQMTGRDRLLEFAAKQASAKDPQYTYQYADALLWRGKLGQANEFFYAPDYQQENSDWYHSAMYTMLMAQDWQRAPALAEVVEKQTEPSIYALVYLSQVLAKQQSQEAAINLLSGHSQIAKPGSWDDVLFRYAMGEIDQAEFMARAKNKCNLTEAHFMLALQALLAGDEAQFRQHTQHTVDQQVYGYYENAAARYWHKHAL